MENDFIDKSSPLPYYIQLKNILLDKISSGEFSDGKLSSEHELAKKYDITVTTVRKTLSELKNEGRIYKVKGLGTFINKPKLELDISKYLSIGRELRQRGINEKIDVVNKKVINFEKMDHRGFVIKNPSEKVILIERVRLIDNEPTLFERLYFNYDICSSLLNHASDGLMYDYLINEVKIRFSNIEEYVEPVNLGLEESKYLKVKKGSAAFFIMKISYAFPDKWIEFTNTYISGDKCRYHVSIR
ncbi:MAG: GntR family transcriptional regulator [Actinobacteria bacterium]|nr:GntR family transcriptional regulator [Actinomycetota bacterium]